MSERPLVPWTIAEKDGRILAAHCDCMAGLGETCTHVASLLWATAAGVERRESLTVTQKSAYWVIPPAIKTVPYAPLSEISFVGKKRKSVCITGTTAVDPPRVVKKKHHKFAHHLIQKRLTSSILWLNVKEQNLQYLLLCLHILKHMSLHLWIKIYPWYCLTCTRRIILV